MRFHDFKPLLRSLHHEMHLLNHSLKVVLNLLLKGWGSIEVFGVYLLNFVNVGGMILETYLDYILHLKY
jgi:hypothetical protein